MVIQQDHDCSLIPDKKKTVAAQDLAQTKHVHLAYIPRGVMATHVCKI